MLKVPKVGHVHAPVNRLGRKEGDRLMPRPCPYCREQVSERAVLCPYCNRRLKGSALTDDQGTLLWGVGLLAVALVLLLVLLPKL